MSESIYRITPGAQSSLSGTLTDTTVIDGRIVDSSPFLNAPPPLSLILKTQADFLSLTNAVSTTAGSFVTIFGYNTCNRNTGDGVSAFGVNAGRDNTGSNSSFFGLNAGIENTFRNVSCLGAFTSCTGDNQVQLGDSSTTLYTYATASRSDKRDKTDVSPLDPSKCVAFILGLNAIKHKWDMRDKYRISQSHKDKDGNITKLIPFSEIVTDGTHKGTRFHASYLAQEVQELLETTGLAEDCSVLKNAAFDGGEDVLSLDKDQLFTIQTVALQDAIKRISALELALESK